VDLVVLLNVIKLLKYNIWYL